MARPSREKRDPKTGKVTRTDHSTMGDVINDLLDGTPSRHDNIKKAVDKAVVGSKKKQSTQISNFEVS